VTAGSIPVDSEELTADWFTSALEPVAPGVEVSRVDVEAAHSGTTGRVRLRLSYSGSADGLPETVFCKIAPFEAAQRDFLRQTGIGVMEARFYAALGTEVPVRLPRVWHAAVDDDGGFVIVLEDLEAAGCVWPRPSDPDIEERAASTVEELSHLHARYWESPRFATDLAWVPERAGFGSAGRDADMTPMARWFMKIAREKFGDELGPAFRAMCDLYAERVNDIHDLWDEGERTLIHGDPHSGNLFTDGARTGFFDWAMFSHSPAMRDVAYYCCNSLPTNVRRANQAQLLDRYRASLAGHGVQLDPSMAEHQCRLFAVYAWTSAACTAAMGSRWQRSDRAVAALERTTTAVEDLDSIGLLTEFLG
jgi:hypothetical protein